MSDRYDIVIKETDGTSIAEFIVGEQTKNQVLQVSRQGVDQGDGHEVPKEDIV